MQLLPSGTTQLREGMSSTLMLCVSTPNVLLHRCCGVKQVLPPCAATKEHCGPSMHA